MAEVLLFHHAQGSRPAASRSRTRCAPPGIPSTPRTSAGPWPPDVPVQVHMMEADALVLPPNGDLEAARRLDATVDGAELFLYPGDRHLLSDRSLREYDAAAAELLERRVLGFLDGIG